jgi:hypothetical protein
MTRHTVLNRRNVEPMNALKRSLAPALLLGIFLVGCSSSAVKDPNQKPVSKVFGEITLDGQLTADIQAVCYDAKTRKKVTTANTGADGKFAFGTYEAGDGLPEGDYVFAFSAGKKDPAAGTFGPPDRLKGRYANPSKSQTKATVVKGKPVDLGKIELTSK